MVLQIDSGSRNYSNFKFHKFDSAGSHMFYFVSYQKVFFVCLCSKPMNLFIVLFYNFFKGKERPACRGKFYEQENLIF